MPGALSDVGFARPSILLCITDDQPFATTGHTGFLRNEITAKGRRSRRAPRRSGAGASGRVREERLVLGLPTRHPPVGPAAVEGVQASLVVGQRCVVGRRVGGVRRAQGVVQLVGSRFRS